MLVEVVWKLIEIRDLEYRHPGDVVEEDYVAWVGPTFTSRDGHLPPYIYRFADSALHTTSTITHSTSTITYAPHYLNHHSRSTLPEPSLTRHTISTITHSTLPHPSLTAPQLSLTISTLPQPSLTRLLSKMRAQYTHPTD